MLKVTRLQLPNSKTLDFELRAGELIILVGPSGSGKTLFLKALSGLIPCKFDQFLYQNEFYENLDWPKVRSQMIYLQQKPVKLSGTVLEILQKPFSYKVNQEKRFDENKLDEYLKALSLGQHFLQKNSSHLSGGEEQMVATMRSLMLNPKILFLDEPTAAIDSERTQAVEDLIFQWQNSISSRPSIIFVTHNEAQEKRLMERGGRLLNVRELLVPNGPNQTKIL